MRTFEFHDAQSHKFWHIELEGKGFTVTFGRVGAAGQQQTKTFANTDAARKAHDKLIAEKLAKGYVETTKPALQGALEQALLDEPDEPANHAAYADYLTEQGDPRGEFIHIQLALEASDRNTRERKQLQKREKALLKEHQREWLGALAPFLLDKEIMPAYYIEDDWEFRFARGWLDALHIPCLTVSLARALVREPRVRLLRRLALFYVGTTDDENDVYEPGPDVPEDDEDEYVGAYPLVRSPFLGNVRYFQMGEDQGDDYRVFRSSGIGTNAVRLVAKMPRVEEIHRCARAVDLNKLFGLASLTNLRVLRVYHMNSRHPLEKLSANPALGQLTHLLLHPHYQRPEADMGDHAYINLAGARAVFRSPHLKRLTHLRLRVSSLGDEGCRELVASGILKRLQMLDLRHGRITDEGARVLAACPDLKNLEHLDIDRNGLTQDGIRALRQILKRKVRADNQQTQAELAAGQYLTEGDFE